MARFACIWLPDLPLAAMLRAEPELRGRPLAIVSAHTEARSVILAGYLRGHALSEAQALCPDLRVRRLSLEAVRSAQEALFDVAQSVTPRVEHATPNSVQLDLEGTEATFPTTGGLLLALETRLCSVGLELARSGIGPSRTIAWLAARHGNGGHVVPTRRVRHFLDPLPIALLDPPLEILERLTRWGVGTLGELRRLSGAALGTRLGTAAVELARRAEGRDLIPFRPAPPAVRFEESVDSEHAIDNLETLGFVLRTALDRLTSRLRLRGLAVRELWLELTLENGEPSARSIGLGGATVETTSLLALIRLSLERDPPAAAVERIRVVAVPGTPEVAQLDFFLPPLPAPAELTTTIARLEALCGPGHVGALACSDGYRLEATSLERFSARSPRAAHAKPELPRLTLALRALRPPRGVRVSSQNGVPVRIELERGSVHVVVRRAGPWRLCGEWWERTRFARDYFDVELASGGLYRLYQDLESHTWFLDGIYD